MREQYYQFIKDKEIQDTLSWMEDLPYSKKFTILNELSEKYTSDIINRSLRQYEERYIRQHRAESRLVRNVLVGLCSVLKEQEKNK